MLLGHNGAGKTTMISIITGFLKHSSGTVSAFGENILESRDIMNKMIGICP